MAVILASKGLGTAAGYDATAATNADVLKGTGTAAGYAALVQGAAPDPNTAPDALRLEILTASGTQLKNDLTARRGLKFTVEHNGSGAISFETDLAALTGGLASPLLDPDNLVRVHYGEITSWPYGVAEGFITSAPPEKAETGHWSLPIQCPGSWDILDFGVLWPPTGAVGDTREFSYTAGQTGPAWVPEEWGTPHGYLVKNSFRWRLHRWPRGWPESQARWLWSSSPETASPLGTRKFVGSFTLTARKDVHFYAAGDETMRLYLNGALIKRKLFGAWKTTASFTRSLPAGTYVVAAEVANVAGGDNKSGFAFACSQLKANGTLDHWLLRSTTTSFQIRTAGGYIAQVPLPPDGWFPPAVLWQHVGEAAARGVSFYTSVVRSYSAAVDTSGSAWTDKGPVEYDIGISGTELGDKVRAGGVDVAMLPGLRLSAWKHRGFDLTGRVKIALPKAARWASRAWPRVRTVGLTHHETGWTETLGDATTTADYGRRELALSGGGVDGDLQADVFATAAMTTAALPEETIEVVITSDDLRAGAPQPFRDFNVADSIPVAMVDGYVTMKVMSITGEERVGGGVDFTIAGYPV